MSFPHYTQLDAMDCGATCLRMIAKHYGKTYSLQGLRDKCYNTREGVSLLGISDAAEKLGFKTIGVKVDFNKLVEEAPLPCIVHWNQNHFVVVYKISKKAKGIRHKKGGYTVYVADPAGSLIKYTKEEFCKCWLSTKDEGEEKGVALLFETTPDFYNIDKVYPCKSCLYNFLCPPISNYENVLRKTNLCNIN